jgi:cell wall-associated NlpC family hydrolase
MLANTKHTKDRMVFSILSTLMFITASTAIYDTSSATAENRIQEARIVTYEVPAPKTSLLDDITLIDKFSQRIDELKSTIETKDQSIYSLKVQKAEAVTTLRETYVSIDQALIALKKHVGKTPYGFGSNPTRWDCSGLTLWFYKTYRGIELPHSATAQQRGGEIVDAPIPGDLVAFVNKGYQNAYHIGVYVGGGLFIHALNPQRDTLLDNVQNFAEKENSRVEYIRYP